MLGIRREGEDMEVHRCANLASAESCVFPCFMVIVMDI